MKIKVGTKNSHSQVTVKYHTIEALIARMLPNVGGPSWADALKNTTNKRKIRAAYRVSALRTYGAYGTISGEAACVIEAMNPLEILAREGKGLYDRVYLTGEAPARRRQFAQSETVVEWQKKWDKSEKGRLTHRITWDIRKWVERPYGEVGFNQTHFLSIHGNYRAFRYRFGHDDSPYCPKYPHIAEDAERVLFHCSGFTAQRAALKSSIGEHFTSENIMLYI